MTELMDISGTVKSNFTAGVENTTVQYSDLLSVSVAFNSQAKEH